MNKTQEREAVRLLRLTLGVIDMEPIPRPDYAMAFLEDIEKPLRYLLSGLEGGVRVPDETNPQCGAQFDMLNSREDVNALIPLADGHRFLLTDKLGTQFKGTYDECIKFLDAGLRADEELARPTFEKPSPDKLDLTTPTTAPAGTWHLKRSAMGPAADALMADGWEPMQVGPGLRPYDPDVLYLRKWY